MKRWLLYLIAVLCVALCACSAATDSAQGEAPLLERAEAARSSWHAESPPMAGWVPVALPDLWTTRWPAHDGVVWYRLRWQQADAATPVAVLLDYVCLSNAVYVNGSLVHRDPQLVEPLTRSWIRPQYFLLDRPLLRQGSNELLVRVSGLSAYQPGFGTVRVGAPDVVHAHYRSQVRWRYDVQLFSAAVGVVLGGVFGLFWLFRREQTVYGWYALSAWLFAAYGSNFFASSPWPFATTDGWQAFVATLYLAAGYSFAMFLLRSCGQRWIWTERVLGGACVAAFGFAMLWPSLAGPNRTAMIVLGGAIYYAGMVAFIVRAWRNGNADERILAACLLIPLLTSGHDFLVFFGAIHGGTYLLALTSPLTMIGLGSVLAHRFATAMRRIENFNSELRGEVEVATRQLGETLAREHQLALANTRASERLQLVRDLHDGFGGSLLGTLAILEQAPATPESGRVIATLKDLRDDLRLIIDTTAHERDTDLAGLLAPLRHRWSQRFDAAGVRCRWTLDDAARLHLGAARSLDLLRCLQEALTNVLKHALPGEVEVTVRRVEAALHVQVRDDGRGFDPAAPMKGMGLASLRARAHRLQARFVLHAVHGEGTTLSLALPLPTETTSTP